MTLADLKHHFHFSPSGLWHDFFAMQCQTHEFDQCIQQLLLAYHTQEVCPAPQHIFHAFVATPFEQLKGVILGQDPYHTPHMADGLAFSVSPHSRIPPSLRVIFNEIERSYGKKPSHGSLQSWANQGILLLNTVLSVQTHSPLSHRHFGWQFLTDAVIHWINKHHKAAFFMLWGKEAQKKIPLIDASRHAIITAQHPSPLAGHHFVGSQCFLQADHFLQQHQQPPISWV
jgi:uracil-DNA glycosylase